VLDTTGSMGGLIEGAKQKIWSIANEMISAQPTPELKLGLIGYRDRGDEYVVKIVRSHRRHRCDLRTSARVPGRWRWRCTRKCERGACRSHSQDALEQRQQSPEDHLSGRRRAALTWIIRTVQSIRISAGKRRKRTSLINTIQCGEMAETQADLAG